MARYDFQCIDPECAIVEEKILPMNEASSPQACSNCGGPMEQLIYATGIIWHCAGATVGYRGGPGTGIPDTSQIVKNPGHEPPTMQKLGLLEPSDAKELNI